jgi:hypothetical protein
MTTITKISDNARIAITAFSFIGVVMLFNCAAWF